MYFAKPCDGKRAEGGELKDGNMSTDEECVCQPFVFVPEKSPKNLEGFLGFCSMFCFKINEIGTWSALNNDLCGYSSGSNTSCKTKKIKPGT